MPDDFSEHEIAQQESGRNLLTAREAARLLDVHPNTVRMWAAKGIVHGVRVAPRKELRFYLADVERLLLDRKGRIVTPNAQRRARSSIWDSPRVKAILERPEGTPIDISGLTDEERDALARDAKGMWSDHPYIKDSVEWVRELRRGLIKGPPENE